MDYNRYPTNPYNANTLHRGEAALNFFGNNFPTLADIHLEETTAANGIANPEQTVVLPEAVEEGVK